MAPPPAALSPRSLCCAARSPCTISSHVWFCLDIPVNCRSSCISPATRFSISFIFAKNQRLTSSVISVLLCLRSLSPALPTAPSRAFWQLAPPILHLRSLTTNLNHRLP